MTHQYRLRGKPFEFDYESAKALEPVGDALEFTDQEMHSGVSRTAPKTIARYNTDLDAPYSGGNFNFLFNGGSSEAVITFNTYLSFRKKYPGQAVLDFKSRLKSAAAVWDGAAEVQVRSIRGDFNTKVRLRFALNLNSSPKYANKMTDVHPAGSRSAWFMFFDKNRPTVVRDVNVFIDSSRNLLVHELGHVWGLLDEYDTQWLERKFSPGHVGTGSPLIKDKVAIMNEGYLIYDKGEFRGRYFKHFGRAILNAFWGLKDYEIPTRRNGKTISRSIIGRIALLKKDIAGNGPNASDVMPFNPLFTNIQVTKI